MLIEEGHRTVEIDLADFLLEVPPSLHLRKEPPCLQHFLHRLLSFFGVGFFGIERDGRFKFLPGFRKFWVVDDIVDFIYAHKRPFALFNGQNRSGGVVELTFLARIEIPARMKCPAHARNGDT